MKISNKTRKQIEAEAQADRARKSHAARREKLGDEGFREAMRETGKLGGRPAGPVMVEITHSCGHVRQVERRSLEKRWPYGYRKAAVRAVEREAEAVRLATLPCPTCAYAAERADARAHPEKYPPCLWLEENEDKWIANHHPACAEVARHFGEADLPGIHACTLADNWQQQERLLGDDAGDDEDE